MNNTSWYAVYTKPFWEKKVAALIHQLEIETYCPLQKLERQWSDRKKIIYSPLFTSYVFVSANSKQLSLIKQVTGVVSLVSFMGKPARIRDEEIEMIRRFHNEFSNIEVRKMDFSVNDHVRVIGGPLMNLEGKIVRVNNKTVEVSLPSLGYVLSASIDKQNVIKDGITSVTSA